MTIVAVTGDCATTTAVALTASWADEVEVTLVEADPTGGDVAAWFDVPGVPSLSTVVTSVRGGVWADVVPYVRRAPNGLAFIPAPSIAAEARQALAESSRSLVPVLASVGSAVAVVDLGGLPSQSAPHPFGAAAAVTVVVHRQSPQSSRAAGVRLQRLGDELTAFMSAPGNLVVAVVGQAPFDTDEISTFLRDEVGPIDAVPLPWDDLGAHVIGGRTGVSERRCARLPLMRATRRLAEVVRSSLILSPDPEWSGST